jgi:multidrug resistance efflux pump
MKPLGFDMAESQEAFEKAGAGYQKPHLRSDLRLVYENPATGKGQVRVIDPHGGRQFVFDENEQYLCRLADGQRDLKEIYVQLVAERGDKLSPAQVVEFYRRLHILGLLAAAGAAVPAAAPAPVVPRGPGGVRGRGPAARSGMATSATGDAAPRESATSRIAAKRSQAAAAAAAAEAAAAALPMPAAMDAPLVLRQPLQEVDDAAEVISPDDAFLSDPILAAPQRPEDPATIAPPADLAPRAAMVPALPPVAKFPSEPPPAAPPAAPSATPQAPISEPVADAADTAVPEGISARKPGMLRALLGGRRTNDAANLAGPVPGGKSASDVPDASIQMDETASDPVPEEASFDLSDIDFYDDDITAPGLGGGMRGGMMGGMRGGMGGGMGAMGGGMRGQGGGMRGGMGGMAGGMGAGMGGMRGQGGGMGGMGGMPGGMGGMRGQSGGMGAMGGMPGMGGMGGMRGGMGGGGMGAMGGMRGGMGGMGGFKQMQQPAKPFTKKPWTLPLFNPTPLLRVLYYLLYPLKYVTWLLFPAVVIAGMIMLRNYQEFAIDIRATITDLGSIGDLLVSLLIVNLVARLAQGVAVIAHGGKVRYIAATLVLGLFPHIAIDKHDAPTLTRQGQMWVHGSTLLSRLLLFCVGIMYWEMYRNTGTLAPEIAIAVSKTALVMFLATAWPLMPSDGMRLMATAMNEPKLQPKALIAFKHLFLGGKLPPFVDRSEVTMLALYALGTLLTMFGFLVFVAVSSYVGVQALGGTGMVIWAAYCLSFTLWVAAVLRTSKKGAKRRGNQPRAEHGFDRSALNGLAFDTGAAADPLADEAAFADAMGEAEPNPTRYAGRVWLLIALAGLAVAFLPYNYETGGPVSILPMQRGQAVARTDGEILTFLVREGDVVVPGQPVAVLSSWDQESQIAITQAQLDGAKASLDKLLAGATPEDIAVARAKVVSAEADLAYTQAQADRARNLAKTGTVAAAEKEKAESALATVLADLEVARANLAAISAPPTQADIEINQANIDKLTRQLAYDKDELTRTTVVTPVAGRVVTQDMNLKIGSFLRSGDTLMEVEETGSVTANIDVPEGDAPFLTTGRPVRLKLQGFADTEFQGEVTAIAPSTETQTYGQTVQVMVNFPNVDGTIVSGMTGYAKIEGAQMRVWEAYMRTMKRFFQIEVWSWIP